MSTKEKKYIKNIIEDTMSIFNVPVKYRNKKMWTCFFKYHGVGKKFYQAYIPIDTKNQTNRVLSLLRNDGIHNNSYLIFQNDIQNRLVDVYCKSSKCCKLAYIPNSLNFEK